MRYRSETATTDSIVMRSKSGTVRRIDSEHRLSKLRAYSAIDFDRAKVNPAGWRGGAVAPRGCGSRAGAGRGDRSRSSPGP
ncbi:hypothetical protein SGRIM128S_06208 [Streptomyces griseomycini]